MNKKYKNNLMKLKKFRPWYFFVLAFISAVICAFALRSNNLHMVSLRSAVYAADKNNSGIETALRNLQQFVTHHMNTNLDGGPNAPYPPIQLEYTYERLQKASLGKLGDTGFYTQAEDYCQKVDPTGFYGAYRIPCVESYLTSHHLNIKVQQSIPPAALYEFDFVSPTWSPDLAGWSMLTAILFAVAFMVSWLLKKSHNARAV